MIASLLQASALAGSPFCVDVFTVVRLHPDILGQWDTVAKIEYHVAIHGVYVWTHASVEYL